MSRTSYYGGRTTLIRRGGPPGVLASYDLSHVDGRLIVNVWGNLAKWQASRALPPANELFAAREVGTYVHRRGSIMVVSRGRVIFMCGLCVRWSRDTATPFPVGAHVDHIWFLDDEDEVTRVIEPRLCDSCRREIL